MSSSPRQTCGLLVIGSGPAGVSAAAAYVEAGGPARCCLVTADADPPYQRPPLSKAVLRGEEPAEVTPILEDEAALDAVEVLLGVHVVDARHRRRTRAHRRRSASSATSSWWWPPARTPRRCRTSTPGAEVLVLRSLEHGRGLARRAE